MIKQSVLLKDVAEYYKVSQQSIIKWMKKYNIYDEFNFKRNVGKGNLGKTIICSEELIIRLRKMADNRKGQPGHKRIQRIKERCYICEHEFIKKESDEKKVCSKKCAIVLRSIENIKSINVVCTYCGTFIEKPLSLIKEHNFCDYNCCNAWRKGKTYEELYGEDKANIIKQKIMANRSENTIMVLTRPHIKLKK